MDTLPNIHPGEVLSEEFLSPFGLSEADLAEGIGLPVSLVSEVCAGQRAVDADMALRLARFFGTTAAFWLGLQADYDTEEAERALRGVLSRIRRFDPGMVRAEPGLRAVPNPGVTP
jgi:addiction module HigA family antidote